MFGNIMNRAYSSVKRTSVTIVSIQSSAGDDIPKPRYKEGNLKGYLSKQLPVATANQDLFHIGIALLAKETYK